MNNRTDNPGKIPEKEKKILLEVDEVIKKISKIQSIPEDVTRKLLSARGVLQGIKYD